MSEFPVESFRDAAPHLRRPFTPGAVKFKVQSTAGNRGMVVGFIDARLVIERLNLVVPHLWYDQYERIDGTALRCQLTVDRITREDVGIGKDVKTLYSDALKRAAVKFGIGVSLYAMKQIWLEIAEKPTKQQLKKTPKATVITPDAESHLRNLYAGWLDLERGGKVFGEPLDHGDDPEGSVGEQADAPTENATENADIFDQERATDQIEGIYRLYDEHLGNGRKPLSKGKLDSLVAAAQNSHEDLAKVEAHVREKLGATA